MSPEVARAALEFMKRVELRGAEVDAFIRVVAALQEIATNPAQNQRIPGPPGPDCAPS